MVNDDNAFCLIYVNLGNETTGIIHIYNINIKLNSSHSLVFNTLHKGTWVSPKWQDVNQKIIFKLNVCVLVGGCMAENLCAYVMDVEGAQGKHSLY